MQRHLCKKNRIAFIWILTPDRITLTCKRDMHNLFIILSLPHNLYNNIINNINAYVVVDKEISTCIYPDFGPIIRLL